MNPETLDEDLLEASRKDARETMRRAASAAGARLRREGTVKTRTVWIETVLDWVAVPYPYTPGEVTGRDAVSLFCGAEQNGKGQVKATRAARSLITRLSVTAGSYAEAAQVLSGMCGMTLSRESVRKVTNEAGRRTEEALSKGPPAQRRKTAWRPPKGARRVPETMLAEPDGICFPCVKADLEGRAGRDGGAARGRNVNIVCLGRYRYVDDGGRPLFPPDGIRYFAIGEGGEEFGKKMWRFAEMEGVRQVRRVEYVSDGEKELECAFQEHFAGLPNVSRALDAMHACGYVDAIVKSLEPDGATAARVSKRLRKRLVNAGWNGFLESLRRRYGRDVADGLGDDGLKAWNYLEARAGQMDYRNLRRRNMAIGSGIAESGCKLIVAARLKGPGMHWRFKNGIRIAILRCMIRSGGIFAA